MYVLDSEGLFDTDKDKNIDSKLTTLIMLLSSLVIFNKDRVIDRELLNDLHFTVKQI